MLRVAVLSRWHVHAGGYAQEFNAREDAKVTIVWDEEADKGKAFAEELGVEFEPDLDKLLAREDVDAVCVNAPTNMHHEVLVKAAKAGKHIFTEKIMALTSQQCMDIKAAVDASGVKFCISYPHRTLPRNLFAKKVLEENLLGKVTYLRVRNAHSGASSNWLPAHFYDAVQCGGGAMIDLGAHPMYLIPWFLGTPEEMTSTFTHVTGREVEDNAVTVMKYKDGTVAVSETGFVSSNSPYMLEIYGTEGSLVVVDDDIKLISGRCEDHKNWAAPAALPASLPSAINQFVDGVLNGGTIVFGMDDAIVLTKMMEAAYASHKNGGFAKYQ